MRGPENIAVGQGAKFGTFAVSRIVNLRWQRMDQRTQNFHFPVSEIPVFHDSGDTDQLVDRRILQLGRGPNLAPSRLEQPIMGLTVL